MTLPVDGPRLTLAPGSAAGQAGSTWKVGQLLQAIVDARLPDGTVTLRVGTLLIEGHSDLPLRPGQLLALQVAQSGSPTVLRIVPETAAETDGINRALRQALPRQGQIQPLLDALAGLTRGPGPPSPALATLAGRLLSRLPDIQTLTVPGEFKQALRDSGAFLEARLARGDAPASDFKAMLLQLQALLRDAPSSAAAPRDIPEDIPSSPDGTEPPPVVALRHGIDAALARLVVNQIDSLPRDTSMAAPLVIELPLWWNGRPGMLRMRIEPDDAARHEENAAPGWSVWLSLEPGELGPVHCRLQLRGEQVSAGFWAERETTAALFRENLGKLESGFQQEGLTPRHMHCQAGKPPLPTPRHRDILDERA